MKSSAGLTDLSHGMQLPTVNFMQLFQSKYMSSSRMLSCDTVYVVTQLSTCRPMGACRPAGAEQ